MLALEPGAHVVLSASGQGSAAQYPRFCLQVEDELPRAAVPATPVTPIVAASHAPAPFAIRACMASGEKTVEIPMDGVFRIGRRVRNRW